MRATLKSFFNNIDRLRHQIAALSRPTPLPPRSPPNITRNGRRARAYQVCRGGGQVL